MGLPEAGKTTLAKKLYPKLNAIWINADKVRKEANDWDFSETGRVRQAKRMKDLAQKGVKEKKNIVADFVCPTPITRKEFNADFVIWVDTIKSGRFDDTNIMFVKPKHYDLRVETKNADYWVEKILEKLNLILK